MQIQEQPGLRNEVKAILKMHSYILSQKHDKNKTKKTLQYTERLSAFPKVIQEQVTEHLRVPTPTQRKIGLFSLASLCHPLHNPYPCPTCQNL